MPSVIDAIFAPEINVLENCFPWQRAHATQPPLPAHGSKPTGPPYISPLSPRAPPPNSDVITNYLIFLKFWQLRDHFYLYALWCKHSFLESISIWFRENAFKSPSHRLYVYDFNWYIHLSQKHFIYSVWYLASLYATKCNFFMNIV